MDGMISNRIFKKFTRHCMLVASFESWHTRFNVRMYLLNAQELQ